MTENTESRRAQAARLFAEGSTQAEVARVVGVSRTTASAWHRLWTECGAEALTALRRVGPKARLDADQETELRSALLQTPRDVGIAADGWSLAGVAAFIEKRTGVQYHHRHVSRLLRRLGWIIPPYGRHSDNAVLAHPMTDPEGNGLLLFQRPQGATAGDREDDG